MPARPNYRKMQVLVELQPYITKAREYSGWSFDELDVAHLDPRMPWDYEAMARQAAARASSIVDLGTGGGERFERIAAGTGGRCIATEEWSVNAPVARDRLQPLGISVIRADSLRLPLGAASVDLVLARHEGLNPVEVARVLTPGGEIITQQVGHDDWPELREHLPHVTFPNHFVEYQEAFRDEGFRIEAAQQHSERVAFRHLGELVYMIMLTPHTFPDFDPVRDIEAVLEFEDAQRTPDGIVMTETHYLLMATKPHRNELLAPIR